MTIQRDGSPATGTGATGTTTLTGLTTSNGSGVIVVGCGNISTGGVTNVTATGLTFTLRPSSRVSTFGFNDLTEWTAPYTSNQSGTVITITSAATNTAAIAQAYSGVPTSSFFDGSVVTSTNPPTSKTTTNANDVVVSICSLSATDTASGIWNQVGSTLSAGSFFLMMDDIVSSTGTYTTTTTSSHVNGNIVDALIASGDILQAQIIM